MADIIKIDADTSGAIAKIDQLSSKLGELQERVGKVDFKGLSNAALALAASLAATFHATLEFADAVADLADANQMAIGEILAMNEALGQSGGKAENTGKALQSLSNKIDEAANGNLKTLGTFEKLGISLQDIGKLSNTELKDKLLDNIAAIEDPMTRNARAVEIFGKAMVGVDIRKFAEEQKRSREEMQKYESAIKTAGDAADKIAQIIERTKIAFAVAFEPLFNAINGLNPSVDSLVTKFRVMAAILAGMVASSVIANVLKLAEAFGVLNAVVGKSPLVRIASILLTAGAAIGTYIGLTKSAGDASEKAGEQASKANKGAARDIGGANEAIDKQKDKLAQIGQELDKNFNTALKKYQQETANLSLTEDEKKVQEALAKISEDGLNAKIKLQNDFEALSKADQKRLQADYDAELAFIDRRTAKQKDAVQQEILLNAQRITLYKDLQAAASEYANFEKQIFEKAVAFGAALTPLKDRYEMEGKLAAIARTRTVLEQQLGKVSEDQRAAAIEAINVATNNVGLLSKGYAAQQDAIEDLIQAEVTYGHLSQQTANILLSNSVNQRAAILESGRALESASRFFGEAQRSFSYGWLKAFQDYSDAATNSAQIAANVFNKFTSGLEDYFINRMKGVQGGWKNFVKGLAEELARAELKQAIAKVMGLFNFGSPQGLIKTMGGLGGMSGQSGTPARGNSPAMPVYVQDASLGGGGPATSSAAESAFDRLKTTVSDFASNVKDFLSNMFSGMGNLISNLASSVGSIISSIGSTLFDVISTVGSTLWDVLGSLGSSLGDILGSIGGGGGGSFLSDAIGFVGSLFGFANGGVIPNNGPVLVGEKGPELLFGSQGAAVMPLNNMGSTNITYNINAVDAMSFKQMIAADPTFIYAVTMQGAKGMPVRR